MKKLVSLSLALMLLVALFACSAEASAINMSNPVTEYASLEELNELLGCNFIHPAVMGVTDERCAVIVTDGCFDIGEYDFSINGMAYCFRFSADYDTDISGVWLGGITAFEGQAGELEYAYAEDMKLARWANIDGQYTLCVKDEGQMEQAQFEGIVDEIMRSTEHMNDAALADYYASLEGEYMDATSQRASATLTANGSDSITISVSWASSASEVMYWDMHATLSEDGLLYYNDCVCATVTYGDDGSESVVTEYENGEGYFGEDKGTLYWSGAADEYCRNCAFVCYA